MTHEQSRSMRMAFSTTKGFTLLEVLLAIALFAILVFGFVGAYLYGQEATITAGNRAQAITIAEQGIEAVRNIRDAAFGNISAGTFGLAKTTTWAFSGTSDVTGIFTRQVVVTSLGTNRWQVAVTVAWRQNNQRNGTVTLTTELSNWVTAACPTTQASSVVFTTTGAVLANTNKDVTGVTIGNAGGCNITISKVSIAWTGNVGKLMQLIQFNGTTDWTGSAGSGVTATLTTAPVIASGVTDTSLYRFNAAMLGSTFTITVTMSDASTKVSPSFSL
jgi:prepilin-type N-terminal cleavage/methylation domain-containing protein